MIGYKDTPAVATMRKSRLPGSGVDEQMLPLYIALDAAKGCAANNSLSNRLCEAVIAGGIIFKRTGSASLFTVYSRAWDAMGAATKRPGYLVGLLPEEYQAVRRFLIEYEKSLRICKVGDLVHAHLAARRHIH